MHADRRAFADAARKFDAATMGFDETLDDGKSKSGALVGRDDVVSSLTEVLEHALQIFRRDSDAGIGDTEGDAAIIGTTGEEGHAAIARRELDRIGKQVQQDLLERTFVAMEEGKVGIEIGDQFTATGLAAGTDH